MVMRVVGANDNLVCMPEQCQSGRSGEGVSPDVAFEMEKLGLAGSLGSGRRPARRPARPRGSDDDSVARVESAVGSAMREAPAPRLVLAVSGGRDSMVMLDAMVRDWRARVACVATFDHGTGAAASAAAALVEQRARELGVAVRRAKMKGAGHDDAGGGGGGERTGREGARRPHCEASWREARWRFLRAVACAADASIVTAHTRDDQVETVFMRVLRGSGARGLAALYARSGVVRPLLDVWRADVAGYARARGVEWIDDPSNQSRLHLRNRVRLDILPALERARPGLTRELLELSRRAGALRVGVEDFVDENVRFRVDAEGLEVARADLRDYDARGLGVLWPALAARSDVVLDRRGTERIAEFTIMGRAGGRIQLSGACEAVLHRDALLLRRTSVNVGPREELPLDGMLSFGGWRFRPLNDGTTGPGELRRRNGNARPWVAALPADRALRVRHWGPGDRMTPYGAREPRRVKGLLRDAGIDAGRRVGWPVVLAGDDIVWVPGVRRSAAATVRSGRPVVVYECDRDDD